MLAVFVGLRFLRKRTKEADQRSYRYYNVRTPRRLSDRAYKCFPRRFADMACCCASRTCPCDRFYALTIMIPKTLTVIIPQ